MQAETWSLAGCSGMNIDIIWNQMMSWQQMRWLRTAIRLDRTESGFSKNWNKPYKRSLAWHMPGEGFFCMDVVNWKEDFSRENAEESNKWILKRIPGSHLGICQMVIRYFILDEMQRVYLILLRAASSATIVTSLWSCKIDAGTAGVMGP